MASLSKRSFNCKTFSYRYHGERDGRGVTALLNRQEAAIRLAKEIGIEVFQANLFLLGKMPDVPALKKLNDCPILFREEAFEKWVKTYAKQLAGQPAMRR